MEPYPNRQRGQETVSPRQKRGSCSSGVVVSITQANNSQAMNGTKLLKMKPDVEDIAVPEGHPTKPNYLQLDRCRSSVGKILVPIDFSLPSKRALEYAAMFVRQFGSSITLLHVLKPAVSYADYGYGVVLRQFVDDRQVKKAQARLNAISKKSLGIQIPAVSIVRTGMPESEI